MAGEQCLFCGIAAGKIPTRKVYEDAKHLAFLDINPRNPGHSIVIPKKHYSNILDMPDKEASDLFLAVKKLAGQVKTSMKSDGVSIGQSNGAAAGQLVNHVHFHVIPRFMNEGPIGLEGALEVKRMDDKMLDQVAAAIKKGKSQVKDITPEKIVSESDMDDDFDLDV
ncbi:MAG: HIT family protein [Nanoarchaeota archaeon]